MDFLERLKAYTEHLTYTPSVIEIGTYQENGNSIAIRPSPANINDRYMDKNKIYPFQFQLLVHHRENLEAYRMIHQLESQYENLSNRAITSSDGSFKLVSFQCVTTPSYVQKTSYGTLWSALFQAELYT
ncbi:minor capsid protein [Oceanobacillus kimchii]|uniref:minor capsid protein n=1 Tax=Oceanobacillus TaxID=182709 RepID=UPI0021A37627|nr:minor capsid protein [Oceanobacillus kimchii]MCT1577950.1 minor capsid protein [Oceanobacillus kimchii]MCT2137510.1 minor capsid protein [Oceanobacillus kimchii]